MPDEVLLWDDCSPEDPSGVVEKYRNKFPRLVYHRNPKNLNMPGNLNSVICHATGEYIANLHDADIFHPKLLEKWSTALDQNPTAGLVFCGLDSTRDNPRYGRVEIHNIPPVTDGRAFFKEWFVGKPNSVIWGTVMVRRGLYEKLLPFNPVYKNWADVDMWMRICMHSDIAYVPEPLIILDNTSTRLRRFSWYRILVSHEMIFENIRRFYATNPTMLRSELKRQVKCLRKRYIRHMAGGAVNLDFMRIFEGVSLIPRIFARSVGQSAGIADGLKL